MECHVIQSKTISYERKNLSCCSNVPKSSKKAKTDLDSKIPITVQSHKGKFYLKKNKSKISYYICKLNASSIRILNQR